MKRLMGVLLAVPLLALQVGELAAQDKIKETPYYPLKVGTTWHYRAGDSKFVVHVVRHEKVGGTRCALLETIRDGEVVGSEHLAVADNGVYRHDLTSPLGQLDPRSHAKREREKKTQTLKPPMLILKLPPKNGDSWRVDCKSDGTTCRGSFQVSEQEITVPAGTYKTFRVDSQDLEVNSLKPHLTMFFAAGVGMVKQIIEMGEAKIAIELEKFAASGQ